MSEIELHVTAAVDHSDPAAVRNFAEACGRRAARPLFFRNLTRNDPRGYVEDTMTSERYGATAHALEALGYTLEALASAGIRVARWKVETRPGTACWRPSRPPATAPYFEHHVKVPPSPALALAALQARRSLGVLGSTRLHHSADGSLTPSDYAYLTVRSRDGEPLSDFSDRARALRLWLARQGAEPVHSQEIEEVSLDTNPGHDELWTRRTDPPPPGTDLEALGEDRHARCAHGRLTEQWALEKRWSSINQQEYQETPGHGPLCMWDVPGPRPPALSRVWGGLIELARDCAVCPCFTEITVP